MKNGKEVLVIIGDSLYLFCDDNHLHKSLF